jgi:hypothetical protein
MRQWHRLGGARLVEDLPAIAAMVLAIRESKRGTTAKTNVRVNPFRGRLRIHHGRVGSGEVLWGKFVT